MKTPDKETKKPELSVVIPTKDEEANVAACIRTFDAVRDRVEVVVVDNFSSDRTREIAAALGARVFSQGPERCAQRNRGWREAAADVILFVDADMILPPETVEEILSIYSFASHVPPRTPCFSDNRQPTADGRRPTTDSRQDKGRPTADNRASGSSRNFQFSIFSSQFSHPLNSQLSTLNSQLSTLNSQLSTLNSQLSTLNSQLTSLYIPEHRVGRGLRLRARNFERSFYDGTCIDGLRVIPRAWLEKVGGYDESLVACEDWDLDRRLLAAGTPTAVTKGHLLHNEANQGLGRLLAKKAYYAKSVDAYRRKWKDDATCRRQFGLAYRFFGVFVERGKWKRLLRHPVLAAVMYAERLLVGATYLLHRG